MRVVIMSKDIKNCWKKWVRCYSCVAAVSQVLKRLDTWGA